MRSVAGFLLFAPLLAAQPASHQTKNVILITADGLRWQEIFTGIDPLLMDTKYTHMKDGDGKSRRELYWRKTPEERRAALLPFFSNELAKPGAIFCHVT